MKHSTAYTELIILVAMMAAFIPIFTIFLYQMNKSTYKMLQDKTAMDEVSIEYVERVYQVPNGHGGYIETSKVLMPNLSEPISYTFGDVVLSLVIFDQLAPDSNVVTFEKRNTKIDMTDPLTYQDKYDMMGQWYKINPGFSNCVEGGGHDKDDIFYLNWIKNDPLSTGACWSFDHDYDDKHRE